MKQVYLRFEPVFLVFHDALALAATTNDEHVHIYTYDRVINKSLSEYTSTSV